MIYFRYHSIAYVWGKGFLSTTNLTALRERRYDGFVGYRVQNKLFVYSVNGVFELSKPKHMKQINNKYRKAIKNDII